MRRWILGGAALALLALLGAAAGYVLYKRHEARNIHGSSTQEFVTTTEVVKGPSPTGGVVWPTYGYANERTRSVNGFGLRPPYKLRWQFGAGKLLEFPPAIAYGKLYIVNNRGLVFALDARTGKPRWHHDEKRCAAASPAVANGIVYIPFLNKPPCNAKHGDTANGEVVAFRARGGDVLWRRSLGPSETSPLVADGLVYVGDWRGYVYAFDAATGETRWRFKTGGEVKGAAALSGTHLFVASYDGHVYALNARTGRVLWRASAQDRLGSRGTFYSTPAVAYGRVYIGSTDRKVYSFGATTGKLRWSYSTGGYVYSSPAVYKLRVYIGSHDGNLYCFDAATGDVKWKFDANGVVSGSPTVVDGIVYFATTRGHTFGLDARTGKLLWKFRDGQYTPVVGDENRLYVIGYSRIYALGEKK